MKYGAARSAIKSGDIIALTHKRARSWYDIQVMAVRFAQASEYAHIAQVWSVGGRLWVLEAVTPLVRMVPLSHFADEGFYWVPIDVGMSEAELEAALEQIGRVKYSKWQAILAFLGRLNLGADRLTQCCEYVITNRRLSGVDLGPTATPAAVVQAALAQGKHLFYVEGK